MKYIDWNKEKNAILKVQRDVCFDDVVIAINQGGLLDIIKHPNQLRYPGQQMYIVVIDKYVYMIPCVEDDEKFFFKTIFPSRKATKKYLYSLSKKV